MAMTQLIDYQGGANPVYIGTSPAGTATSAYGWTIQRITYDANGNPIAIQYAGNTATAPSSAQSWDARTSLTYS